MRPLARIGLGVLLAAAVLGPAPAAAIELLQERRPPPTVGEARELVGRGDYAEAIFRLRETVERQPGDAEALALLGFCYDKVRDYRHARRSYEAALASDPDNRAALAYLGAYDAEIGDLASARSRLDRLKRLCPTGCPERDRLERAVTAAETGAR